MSVRFVVGMIWVIAGIVGCTASGLFEWQTPLGMIISGMIVFPGMALADPPMERTVGRWLGRPVE